jgi:uncharacterized membrane protein
LILCAALDLFALAVWTGGLLVIVGAVIPAVFNTFGMEPGGRFLTRVFDGYNKLTVGAILVLVGTAGWRLLVQALEPDGGCPVSRAEVGLLTSMVVIATLIILVLGPAAVRLQETAFAAKVGEPRKEAYDAFFHVHHVVRGLYLLNLTLGMTLMVVKIRGWMSNAWL